MREALRATIARHGGAIDWTVDHTGWVVTLYLPEECVFSGGTLEGGLLACLVWLVASESPAARASVTPAPRRRARYRCSPP